MVSKAKMDANNRYNAKALRQVMVKINRNTEPDLLDYIESMLEKGESVQGYIKNLIREDMKKKGM